MCGSTRDEGREDAPEDERTRELLVALVEVASPCAPCELTCCVDWRGASGDEVEACLSASCGGARARARAGGRMGRELAGGGAAVLAADRLEGVLLLGV